MPRGYVPQGSIGASRVDNLLAQLELDILSDVVRRLKKAKKITSTADWQLNRLEIIGNGTNDIRRMVQTATGATQAEMAKLYADAAKEAYTRDAGLYAATGRQQIPYRLNLELQQIVKAVTDQTNSTIQNITKSTGFMVKGPNGFKVFTPTGDIYNKYLDQAIMGMLSGAFDYNAMIRKVTAELTGSGLRSVDYASGRSSRVYVAARRALLTGYGQVTSRVTFHNAAALDTDLFEVTWHPDARPEHQLWQGKVYTRRQLETVCGYGTVTGLCGANCRHVFYPFVKNVSKRQWTDESLDQLNAEENTPKTYKGKDYTDYQATQEQRRLEVAMRAYIERAAVLEAGDADEEDITIAKAKFQGLKAQYKAFSKHFGLPEQWERVNIARVA